MSDKWRTIALLSLSVLFSMAVYFSASAVVPALTKLWSLDDSGQAWLTMSVQLGFVIGALLSALTNLSDIDTFSTYELNQSSVQNLAPVFSLSKMSAVFRNFEKADMSYSKEIRKGCEYFTGPAKIILEALFACETA